LPQTNAHVSDAVLKTSPTTPLVVPRPPVRLGAILLVGLTFFAVAFASSLVLDRVLGRVVHPATAPIANSPNFHGRRTSLEFDIPFDTNSQGLRYAEIPLRKPDGEFRALMLGDSMTEGWGVESNQTFSALLESQFSTKAHARRFINAGLAGRGPLEYGRLLASVGLQYQPDLVVIDLHPNDLTDTVSGADLALTQNRDGTYEVQAVEATWEPSSTTRKIASSLWPWLYKSLQRYSGKRDGDRLESIGLIESVTEQARRLGIPDSEVQAWRARIPPQILEACDRGAFNRSVVAMGCLHRDLVLRMLDVAGPSAEKSWQSMRHVLTQIVNLCRQHRIRIGVVFLSTPYQYDETLATLEKTLGVYYRREWLTEPSSEAERRLRRWADESSVPFLSLTDDLRKSAREKPGTLNYPLDGHWTAEGHRVAAKAIASWLDAEMLVK